MLGSLQPLLFFVIGQQISYISTAIYRQKINVARTTPGIYPGPVDILLSFKIKDLSKEQRLYGRFSTSGTAYETIGDVVQAPTLRACDASKVDRTMSNHIVVMFYDDDHTYLAGCVSLDNQVSFAQSSNALALVVGPESRVAAQLNKSRRGRIPVVMLNDNQTNLLKAGLVEATKQGSVARIQIRHYTSNTTNALTNLRLQVLRPTVVNIGLFVFLILLILFIGGLVFIKIKWRSASQHDLHLRTLAKSALDKMEIRKFVKNGSSRKTYSKPKKSRKLFCFSGKSRNFSVLGSLYSIAPSCGSQERCSICLEEYKEGQELRVLFCGHEFHSKCVDPWLLSNRRCPLCQYDVVYKQYPESDKNQSPKLNRPSSSTNENCNSQQEIPLLPAHNNASDASSSLLSSNIPYMQLPYETNKRSDGKQRYRRIPRNEFFCNCPMSSTRSVRAQVSCAENLNRRRQDMLSRRSSRRNFQHKSRLMGASHRRRYHKPRMVLSTVQSTNRENFVEPLEPISGYSSDVSSYPDPDRPSGVNDLALLLYSFSLSQSSNSDEGNLNAELGSTLDLRKCKKFSSTLRPQNRISFPKTCQINC